MYIYTLVIYGYKLSNECPENHYSVICSICGHSVQVLQTSSSMGVGNFGIYWFHEFKDIFKWSKLHQIPRLESQATWKIVIKNLSLIAVKRSGCYACMDKNFHKVFSVGEFSLEFICFHDTFMWWTWEIMEFKSEKNMQTPMGAWQVWVLRSKHFCHCSETNWEVLCL